MSAASSSSTATYCAFFGATGGCTNAALALALGAGKKCTALARTPQKLTDMLLAKSLSQETLSTRLTIVKGDVRDPEAVKSTLLRRSDGDSDGGSEPKMVVVDLVMSGLGMNPFSTTWDSTLCQDGAAAIVAALADLNPAQKPRLIAISSTGISDGPRDVPTMLGPVYAALKVPHKDKKAMEAHFVAAAEGPEAVITSYTFVRPTLLKDGKHPKGLHRVRAGTEERPAMGYSIERLDVGAWIFENLIRGDASNWRNAKPTLAS